MSWACTRTLINASLLCDPDHNTALGRYTGRKVTLRMFTFTIQMVDGVVDIRYKIFHSCI